MVTYPDGVTGWLAERLGKESKQLTAGEARLLDDLGLLGVKDAADIEEVASTRAQTTFGGAGIADGARRRIAQENPDANSDELASLVEQAVRDGQAVVIGQDGNLGYSDQVPIGGTGQAPNVPQPPGVDPGEPDDTRWSGGYHPGDKADDDYTTSGDY